MGAALVRHAVMGGSNDGAGDGAGPDASSLARKQRRPGTRASGCVGAVLLRGPGPGGNGATRHKFRYHSDQVVYERERRAYLC